MKINKNELKELASKVSIDLNDVELEDINNSIEKITKKLDDIFNEDTHEEVGVRTSAYQEHDLEKEVNEDFENVDMSRVNNFDGTYVKIKKETDE